MSASSWKSTVADASTRDAAGAGPRGGPVGVAAVVKGAILRDKTARPAMDRVTYGPVIGRTSTTYAGPLRLDCRPRFAMLPAEERRRLRLVAFERFLLGVPTELPARPVRDVTDMRHDRRAMSDLGGRHRRAPALDAIDEVLHQQVG